MTAPMSPFRVDVPEAELDDLRERLDRTRWPEPATVDDWSQGVPLPYLRGLCRYWARDYDWRRVEARLNAHPQFRTQLDGLGFHVLHARSPHPDAMPLVITHGWPGSVIEFLKVIGPLTDPPAYGGRASDAFDVVCPSLPGYGFSDKPVAQGWTVERTAAAWAELMARLGYDRYGAQGNDWGTSVSACLARLDPDHVAGIHLTPPLAAPDPDTFDDLTVREQDAIARMQAGADDNGYATMHRTRPQTIGYSLVDSPVGLCAWIVEKLRDWTDCDGDLENVLTRDQILDLVTLYWLTKTGASSARLYRESIDTVHRVLTVPGADPVHVPTGGAIFPQENQRPSRRWVQRRFTDLRHWSEPPRGGHFAAYEQPDLFVQDVRAFFRLVR